MNTNKLRELAEKATPGKWMHLLGDRFVYDRLNDGCRGNTIVGVDSRYFSVQEANNLDYVAAANPATILALLDERDALLSIVRDAGFLLDMLRTGENGEKYDYVNSRHKSMMLVGNVVDDALQAITKAESAS